jgi:hypothetical protein
MTISSIDLAMKYHCPHAHSTRSVSFGSTKIRHVDARRHGGRADTFLVNLDAGRKIAN